MLMESSRSAASDGQPDLFRDAVRAVTELRRGAAIVVSCETAALAVAAAETVQEARLADLRRWADVAPMLVRAAAPGDEVGAQRGSVYALSGRDLQENQVRRLADPTLAPLMLTRAGQAAPDGSAAALALAKLAYLLPALVVAPLTSSGIGRAAADGAIVVASSEVTALKDATRRVVRVGEARVPLRDAAHARVAVFRNPESGTEHVAVVIGAPDERDPAGAAPLVRLHSECFTGDVLGSLRCDCGPQLHAALGRMQAEGAGVLLYLAQEGRGIGLLNKLRSYVLQDRGLDTFDANAALGWAPDERDYGVAAAMLSDLGVRRVRLLTNNPAKVAALAEAGIAVQRASLLVAPNGTNDAYLATKTARFEHLGE